MGYKNKAAGLRTRAASKTSDNRNPTPTASRVKAKKKTALSAPRRGRGKAKNTLALIEAIVRILVEVHPASVRAVCYRLFVAGLIPSMAVKYTSMVSKLLVWARETGRVPWAHVVDETREAERIATWDNPEEIIDAAVNQYRKDYWATQPEWIEVWSEKGTIRGTLAPVLKQYGVTFRVMHGYGSATSVHGIAEETAQNDKRLTVLYVGDWDPSGMNMSEVDLPRRMERYEGDADIVRIALNDSDVAPGTDLPSFEIETKSKDPRNYSGQYCGCKQNGKGRYFVACLNCLTCPD